MEATKRIPAQEEADDVSDEKPDHGKIYLRWEFPEFPRYKRGFVWYLVTVMIGAGLLLYALVSGNFLFALIILMFALVIYMATVTDPVDVEIVISEDGVSIGKSFFPYREVKNFWFVYEPPTVRNLYIEFKSSLRQRLTVDLEDQNPNEVRRALSRHVPEDLTEEDEPLADLLGRMFKL